MSIQTVGGKRHAKMSDWQKAGRGLPSTARISDAETRRVCEAIAEALEYLMEKIRDVHKHDEMDLTDITKKPGRYTP